MIRRIVVVQVVLYLLLALIDEVLTLVSPMRWWDAGSLLAFQPTMDYLESHPWTLLTYIIPHDSLLQLIGVCLLLTLIDRTPPSVCSGSISTGLWLEHLGIYSATIWV